jgi:hypothetical protein
MRDIKKIDEDLRVALKDRDEDCLRTLRMLKTAIRNKEVELKRKLEDEESLRVINTLAKQRRESIEQFNKGGRADLVEVEERELKILLEYLPPALSEEELIDIVKEAIAESGASSPKEMGRVMKLVVGKVAGRADGKTVSSLVVKLLQPEKSS